MNAPAVKTAKLEVGMYIKVPKGTEVYNNSSSWYNDVTTDPHSPSLRETVVQVSDVREFIKWEDDLSVPPQQNLCGRGGYRYRQKQVSYGWYVYWSGGKRYTKAENVQICDAPPPRKEPAQPVKREPTLRQKMVKGTKWRLTMDAGLVKPAPSTPGNYRSVEPDGVIPAGTEIEIVDKFQTYGPNYATGLWVPVKYGNVKLRLVEFNQLNQPLSPPVQVGEAEPIPVFYIWDKAEQKYYSGYDYNWETRGVQKLEYTDKLTKAKKFNRLNDARVHALIQSGYYANLPTFWGDIPEWMMSDKMFDIPETWEIVKIDKLTKNELARYELIDTFKRTWKLRALTVKYGSAVRQVYSDLEKKGKLDDFSAMLIFNKVDNDRYWYDYELTDAEKADIQAIIEQFDKADVKVQKSKTGFAIAAKDVMTATMVRLAYSGELECSLIDFKTMEDVVAEGK